MRARTAAFSRWANADSADRKAQADALRAGSMRRFEDQVDPNRTLTEAERSRRARAAEKAHMCRMSLASSKARRRKARAA